MRFFTRQWLSGELDDAVFEAVPESYRLHLKQLQLPPSVLELDKINLHDAILLNFQRDTDAATLSLQLRCGDLQRGYYDAFIEYRDTELYGDSLSVLHLAMRDPKDEFLYDELDRNADRYEHRIILASGKEVYISFSEVTVATIPVGHRYEGINPR